jgi:hypothetical protein
VTLKYKNITFYEVKSNFKKHQLVVSIKDTFLDRLQKAIINIMGGGCIQSNQTILHNKGKAAYGL